MELLNEKDGDQIQVAAGAVKHVAKTLMDSVEPLAESTQLYLTSPDDPNRKTHSSCSEEDAGGYSEGCDDLSIGIDLPNSSGNDTPVPTTGELEDIISHEGGAVGPSELILTPPHTPQLRSLLKKPSFDEDQAEDDGAKKAVHFSDNEQNV